MSDVIEVPFQTKKLNVNYIRDIEPLCIPAETEVLFYAKCPLKLNDHDFLIYLIEEKQFHKYETANTMCKVKNGLVLCR